MKNKIILNIPHSSTKLTKEYKNIKKYIHYDEINTFNFTFSDLFTDKLFSYKKYSHIKAKYSRICVDVEKFVDDNLEIMAKYGLGVIYSKNLNSNKILDITNSYRNLVLNKYYYTYHNKLDNTIKSLLNKNSKVILIDCHSFCDEIILDKNLKTDLPDICIGVDNDLYNNKNLTDYVFNYFKNLGYNVKINYPYYGTMIPNYLFKENNNNFFSLMIEINRNIYLENFKKNKNFKVLKNQISTLLNNLKTLTL